MSGSAVEKRGGKDEPGMASSAQELQEPLKAREGRWWQVLRPRDWFVVAFTLAYILAAVVYEIVTGDYRAIAYLAGVFVLVTIVAIIHYRIHLPLLALWGVSIGGLAHLLGGMIVFQGGEQTLYDAWILHPQIKYDRLVHVYGSAVATYVLYRILLADLEDRKPSFWPLTISCLAALGIGAFNEAVEFFAKTRFNQDNIGGYINNSWDLVSNLVGVVIAAVFIRLLSPHRPDVGDRNGDPGGDPGGDPDSD